MIAVERDGGLLTLTLNRPEKANALTEPMLADLAQAVEGAKGVQAMILTGAGRVFSAGADLDAARAGLATSPIWRRLSDAIATRPFLTIAALNGTLAGGAMGMALACDIRISVPDAAFFYPVMKLGFLPQQPDPQRLAQLVGPARAKMILLTGARIKAEEALSWGLIDQIAPPDDLMGIARSIAADALAASPEHLAAIKAMI